MTEDEVAMSCASIGGSYVYDCATWQAEAQAQAMPIVTPQPVISVAPVPLDPVPLVTQVQNAVDDGIDAALTEAANAPVAKKNQAWWLYALAGYGVYRLLSK